VLFDWIWKANESIDAFNKSVDKLLQKGTPSHLV